MSTDAYWCDPRRLPMTSARPREDRRSSTVEAAALHERWRGQENGEDERPTLAECERDEAGSW